MSKSKRKWEKKLGKSINEVMERTRVYRKSCLIEISIIYYVIVTEYVILCCEKMDDDKRTIIILKMRETFNEKL